MPALRAIESPAIERCSTLIRLSIFAYSSHISEEPSTDKLSQSAVMSDYVMIQYIYANNQRYYEQALLY